MLANKQGAARFGRSHVGGPRVDLAGLSDLFLHTGQASLLDLLERVRSDTPFGDRLGDGIEISDIQESIGGHGIFLSWGG